MSKMTLNYMTRHGREKSLLLAPILQHAITWKKTLNYYRVFMVKNVYVKLVKN